jgi:hypothetical protein
LLLLLLLFSSSHQSSRFTATCTYAREKAIYRVLEGKPEGNRQLGRPRRRGEDNMNMDFQGVEYDGMDWIDLTEDRDRWRALVIAVMNFRVP